MATIGFTQTAISNDATFRAYGQRISNALVTVGLVRRTAEEDSGQINWATVARPIGAATSAGYEMFRFADALQATAPVLIKVTWGTGTSGTASFRISFEVGTATNGAGTFTSLTSMAAGAVTYVDVSAVTGPWTRISGATNRLCVALNSTSDTAAEVGFFALERTHDSTGGDTAEGVFILSQGYYSPSRQANCFTFSGGCVQELSNAAWSALLPSVGHGSTGTQTSFYPVFMARGPYLNPSLNVGVGFNSNYQSFVPFSLTLLGATRIFMPIYTPTAATWAPPVRGAVGGCCVLMRWE